MLQIFDVCLFCIQYVTEYLDHPQLRFFIFIGIILHEHKDAHLCSNKHYDLELHVWLFQATLTHTAEFTIASMCVFILIQ